MNNPAMKARLSTATFLEMLGLKTTPHIHALLEIVNCMDVAEQEIAKLRAKYTRGRGAPVAKRLKDSYQFLRPSKVLRGFLDGPLYRVHVRELLERVIAYEALEPGTDAECLAAMSHMSLQAPPDQDFTAAMHVLFKKHLPEQWKQVGFDKEPMPKEYTPDGVETILRSLRRQLATKRGPA